MLHRMGCSSAAAGAGLREELRLARGPVPTDLADASVRRTGFAASHDAFLLTVSPDLCFHYRRGAGVTYAAGVEIDAAAVTTFHQGSVHGAVAWMNGYLPFHASAIAHEGGAHAFAGVSGAGKSTLTAALGSRGYTRFADDIVTLSVAGAATPVALPGHKRLKLWRDALALTGHAGCDRVWPGVDKYYVEDDAARISVALPLASLTVIEENDAIAVTRLSGTAVFMALRDHCYRPDLRSRTHGAQTFAQLAAVASSVPVFRFTRPRDVAFFDEGVDTVVNHIRDLSA